MAISFFGHSFLPPREAQVLLDHARAQHPAWFGEVFILTEAKPPAEPFGREIAREFGIEAESGFSLHVNDKERLAEAMAALDYLYRLFGPALVITREMDEIHPPPKE